MKQEIATECCLGLIRAFGKLHQEFVLTPILEDKLAEDIAKRCVFLPSHPLCLLKTQQGVANLVFGAALFGAALTPNTRFAARCESSHSSQSKKGGRDTEQFCPIEQGMQCGQEARGVARKV